MRSCTWQEPARGQPCRPFRTRIEPECVVWTNQSIQLLATRWSLALLLQEKKDLNKLTSPSSVVRTYVVFFFAVELATHLCLRPRTPQTPARRCDGASRSANVRFFCAAMPVVWDLVSLLSPPTAHAHRKDRSRTAVHTVLFRYLNFGVNCRPSGGHSLELSDLDGG